MEIIVAGIFGKVLFGAGSILVTYRLYLMVLKMHTIHVIMHNYTDAVYSAALYLTFAICEN